MSQIEKQQFKNNLHGWIGVVLIGPKGDDRGGSVEPGGTVWLSEAEQVLTANAPRSAADNPFIAQMWPVANPETGEVTMTEITPLTPVAEGRFVPAQERYVPSAAAAGARGLNQAQVAATGPEPAAISADDGSAARREAEVIAAGTGVRPNHPAPAPAIPAAAAKAAAAAKEERARQEAAQEAAQGAPTPDPWTPPVQEPSAPPATPDDPSTPTFNEATQDFAPPAVEGEEHAAKVDTAVGEETGAAPPPTGEPTVGSYTASEEVGTPEAAQAQPPPFTPPEE